MEGICYCQSSDVINVGEDVGVDYYGFGKQRSGEAISCSKGQDKER
jgi:hypothetical protein